MSKVKSKSAKDVNWDAAPPEAPGIYQAILLEGLKEKLDVTNALLNQLLVAMNKQADATKKVASMAMQPATTNVSFPTKKLDRTNELLTHLINSQVSMDQTNALIANLTDTVISQAEEAKRAGVVPGNLQGTNTLLNRILTALKDQVDEGKFQDHSGTATTVTSVVDLLKVAPYKPVDELILTNDGSVNLYFWINEVENTGGSYIKPNESLPISYNNGAIKKLFLKTQTGSADYRLFFLW